MLGTSSSWSSVGEWGCGLTEVRIVVEMIVWEIVIGRVVVFQIDVVAVSVVVSVTGTYCVTLTHIVGAGGHVNTMVSLKVVVLTISEPGGKGGLLLGI